MSQALAKQQHLSQIDAAAVEAALIQGDLSRLTSVQKVGYFNKVCDLVGLNPTTKPFDYLKLPNGKEVLYANKGCGEQLRSIHKISIRITDRTKIDDVYIVTADATNAEGRVDSATGAVPVAGLKGEALANAMMKAETKAKRRVTLSICGLNMLDESEVDSIPGASRAPDQSKAQALEAKVTKKVTPIQAQQPEVLPPEPAPAAEPSSAEVQAAVAMVEEEFGIAQDLGDYICKFGKKFKGMKLSQIPRDQLEGYVNWLDQQVTPDKPLSGDAAEFREYAIEYLGRTEPGSEG